MYRINDNDLYAVFNELKDKYPLTLTNTESLNEDFTINCPVIVGKNNDLILELYVDDDMFVLDIINAQKTQCTHWHPWDISQAVQDIKAFMDGRTTYKLQNIGK